MAAIPSFVCPYCIDDDFAAPSEVLLLRHIRVVHSLDPNFNIQCSTNGCSRTFTNFRTYQNHLLTHRPSSCISPAEPAADDLGSDTADANFETSITAPHVPTTTEMQSFAAKWTLKTSETRSLTRRATLGIVEDVTDLVDFITENLKDLARFTLAANGVDSAALASLEDVFSS